jgi:hypothetical protein
VKVGVRLPYVMCVGLARITMTPRDGTANSANHGCPASRSRTASQSCRSQRTSAAAAWTRPMRSSQGRGIPPGSRVAPRRSRQKGTVAPASVCLFAIEVLRSRSMVWLIPVRRHSLLRMMEEGVPPAGAVHPTSCDTVNGAHRTTLCCAACERSGVHH